MNRAKPVKRKTSSLFNLPVLRDIVLWLNKKRVRQFQRIVGNALPIVRKRLKVFKQLNYIDSNSRIDLLKTLTKHETIVVIDREKADKLGTDIIITLGIPISISILVAPYVIAEWFSVWYGWLAFIGIWYASIALFVVLILLLSIPFLIPSHNHSSSLLGLFWFTFGLITYGYVLYYIYPLLTSTDVAWQTLVLASSIVQVFVYMLSVLLVVTIALGLSKLFSGRIMAHAPDSMFVDKVLATLEIVTSKNKSWNDIGVKNELMREIEAAARVISERIPRALKTQDPDTDAWFAKRCNQIAANLRAKKTWICMPKSDTKILLEENLSRLLVGALSGTWDELETSSISQPLRPSIKARIRTFISNIFIALLPATVYFSAQKLNLLASGSLQEYLGFGVVSWAVLVILLAVDPRFGDKVGAFEKVGSVILGQLKKSDKEK